MMAARRADFEVGRRQPSDPSVVAAAGAGMVRALKPYAAANGEPRPVDSWVLTVRQVDVWLKHAEPGDKLTYARGRDLIRGETTRHMGILAEIGLVALVHPRSKDQAGFDHIAIKQAGQGRSPARREKQAAAAPLTPAMSAILLRLKEAARLGQRCPSDTALGSLTGLTRDQASWELRKLELSGIIVRRVVAAPGEPKWRVVTIVATGQQTALPPHWPQTPGVGAGR